jgi:cytochrome c oxidase subunit IV
MTSDPSANPPEGARLAVLSLPAAFAALLALTACELYVVGSPGDRAVDITALAGLLMVKVGLVLSFFMRARASRHAARLTLLAIALAAGVAVVFMLETVFRVRSG